VHVLSALLLFGLVRRTLEVIRRNPFAPLRDADIACATALIWAVHPLTSEPVLYLTQRTESMMALCFLLTMYANARALTARRPRNWRVVAVAACLAGAGCKETIAVAPVAVVLYDRVFVFPSFRDAFERQWKVYGGLALTWVALALLLVSGGQSIAAGFESTSNSAATYFFNQPRMILRYLRLAVWPDSLVLYYGWTRPVLFSDVWPSVVVVGLLFCGMLYALRRRPVIGFLAAFVFLTLGPTSSLIPIATEVAAERRMYLPMTAIAVAFVLAVARVSLRAAGTIRPTSAFAVATAVLVAALSLVTYARTGEYASALTMAQTVLDRWPTANAEYMVGTELAAAGQREKAIGHLQAAARDYPPANYPLGVQLLESGRAAEGMTALQQFIAAEPTALASRRAHGLLANTLADQERFREAISHYREYLAAHENDADAWNALGVAHIRENQLDEAIASFRTAVKARPGDDRLLANLHRAEALRQQPYK